jgi:hypothetical protein
MNPFTFEELQKILELKTTELATDELIFNATLTLVENILGFELKDKNYNELQTVLDSKVFTKQDNITEMVNIIDMNTKQKVPNCVINGRTIFFISPEYEGHVVFLNYNAGFTSDTLPADLKEALIKIFLIKKSDFYKKINYETSDSEITIPRDIQNILDIYKRKSL